MPPQSKRKVKVVSIYPASRDKVRIRQTASIGVFPKVSYVEQVGPDVYSFKEEVTVVVK